MGPCTTHHIVTRPLAFSPSYFLSLLEMQGGGRRHVGLGSTGQASGNMSGGAPQFAAASFPSMTASDSWDGQKFSLFVGNLADGVIDGWLERILGVSITP